MDFYLYIITFAALLIVFIALVSYFQSIFHKLAPPMSDCTGMQSLANAMLVTTFFTVIYVLILRWIIDMISIYLPEWFLIFYGPIAITSSLMIYAWVTPIKRVTIQR
jgi:hypothetical protein